MGAQQALVSTVSSIGGAISSVGKAIDKEEQPKEEQPKSEPSKAPETPQPQESLKLEKVKQASKRSQDSLAAARLQKQRRTAADHMNLVNKLRRMRDMELAKREEAK